METNGDDEGPEVIIKERGQAVDYPTALVYQLGRINQIGSRLYEDENTWQDYESAVEEFSILLEPYKDPKFIEEYSAKIKPLADNIKEVTKPNRKGYGLSILELRNLTIEATREHMRLLVRLCAARGFFPEKRGSLKA